MRAFFSEGRLALPGASRSICWRDSQERSAFAN